MSVVTTKEKCSLEDALNKTGFGKYSVVVLITCCSFILALYIDIFGIAVVMPEIACDLNLSTSQQGILTAMSLIGVTISSYGWGICVDTFGRRSTLMVAMPTGMFFNFLTSLMPNFWSLAVVKFLSGAFTSSANAGTYVLLAESVPQRLRSRMMFLMTTAIMFTQFIVCLLVFMVFNLTFRIDISWLGVEYRPWRLMLQIICLPGALGCLLCSLFINESPKFLLYKNKTDETMEVLESMYSLNTGNLKTSFPVRISQEHINNLNRETNSHISFLRKMWDQTAPLFKPPLLKNTLILYYLLLCTCMTSTGFSIWMPTITNAFFNGGDVTGKTFCDVATHLATTKNLTVIAKDCDHTIEVNMIYATMVFSATAVFFNILLSYLVVPLGKKKSTQMVFIISLICGITLHFVRIPILSIAMFFMYLYASLILGNISTYLVELNPTHLRGMVACLSTVVSRGFGFLSVQIIGITITDHCTPMMSSYMIFVGSGMVVSFFLPADTKKIADPDAV